MMRLSAFALALIVASPCFVSQVKASFIYEIVPVELPQGAPGHALAGGYFETNINHGLLLPENILDFEVIVTGPFGQTFSATDGESELFSPSGMVITPGAISVPSNPPDSQDPTGLSVINASRASSLTWVNEGDLNYSAIEFIYPPTDLVSSF